MRNLIGRPEYRDVLAQLRRRLHGELAAIRDGLINRFSEKQLLGGAKLPIFDENLPGER